MIPLNCPCSLGHGWGNPEWVWDTWKVAECEPETRSSPAKTLSLPIASSVFCHLKENSFTPPLAGLSGSWWLPSVSCRLWDVAPARGNPESGLAKPPIADTKVISNAWFSVVKGCVSRCLARYVRSSSREEGLKKKQKPGVYWFLRILPSSSWLWYCQPVMRLLLNLDWFLSFKSQHKTTLSLGNLF